MIRWFLRFNSIGVFFVLEIRTHGVGYYSFSVDEDMRKQQQEELKLMREKTTKNREARAQVLAKRKQMMKERLAKVKERKLLRAGLPIPGNKTHTSLASVICSFSNKNFEM